jgi:hypothetical protein
MEPYQQRVVTELNDLREKRAKLGEFLRSPEYKKIPDAEKNMLTDQHEIMLKYEGLLDRRVELFKSREPAQPNRN